MMFYGAFIGKKPIKNLVDNDQAILSKALQINLINPLETIIFS